MATTAIRHLWPQPRTPEDIPDVSRWICIYPAYIDSTRTIAQGRKVRKDTGIPGPNVLEIFHAVYSNLQVPVCIEAKTYSRSWWDIEPAHFNPGDGCGRVRVRLKDPDGNCCVDASTGQQISSRIQLLRRIVELMPETRDKLKLHERPDPTIQAPKTKASSEEKGRDSGSRRSNKKKRGKKKKKR